LWIENATTLKKKKKERKRNKNQDCEDD